LIALLVAIVVPKVGSHPFANKTKARADISTLQEVLKSFRNDTGRYPTTNEGLNALIKRPVPLLAGWNGPYLTELPTDPWGRKYVYRRPGLNGSDVGVFWTGLSGKEGNPDNIGGQ
jgi:general secretion pathway protein G